MNTTPTHAAERVDVRSPASEAELAAVDAGLDAHNTTHAPLADVAALHVIATDAGSGAVVGGAVGRTWGACCELQQIWVAQDRRRGGLGSRLLARFEAAARERGCELVYLDTFTFQAPAFYARHGYVEVLRTPGYTGGIAKLTFHKLLGSGQALVDATRASPHPPTP